MNDEQHARFSELVDRQRMVASAFPRLTRADGTPLSVDERLLIARCFTAPAAAWPMARAVVIYPPDVTLERAVLVVRQGREVVGPPGLRELQEALLSIVAPVQPAQSFIEAPAALS